MRSDARCLVISVRPHTQCDRIEVDCAGLYGCFRSFCGRARSDVLELFLCARQ